MSTISAERLCVLVAADHALVAETIQAALTNRGHHVVQLSRSEVAADQGRDRGGPVLPEVGLLLSDLDTWSSIQESVAVVERTAVPWVALTGATRGPAWGALFAAGVELVLPDETNLEELGDLLVSVGLRGLASPAEERARLEIAWRAMRARHRDVIERVDRLTPGEHDILSLMHEGCPSDQVAEVLGVSPVEVRRNVESLQRKLRVTSSRAAVAVFEDFLDLVAAGRSATA